MEGRIWVESRLGDGSTFRFTSRFRTPSGPRTIPPLIPDRLRGLRVLVAVASPLHRRILAEFLESWGLEPSLADDGREAVDALERSRREGRPFPLVLLDVRMLGPDGIAVAGRIRDEPGLADGLILIASLTDRLALGGMVRDLGAASSLQRPIRQEELLAAILATIGATPPTERRPAPPAAHRDGLEEGRPLRILLAEDHPFNRRVASQMLQKRGYEIVMACNGEEALEMALKDRFDLVLMDVQMPVMDGLRATAAIRAAEVRTGRHLPIIALTAHAMNEDRDRCLEAGMDDYLTKPIQQDRLWDAIAKSVTTARADATSRPREAESARMINVETALARVDGDRAFLTEMTALFLVDCPRLMGGIRAAIDKGDASRVQADTHALKNWVGNFSAPSAFEAALAMEAMGHAGDLGGAEAAYAALEREIERLGPELAQFLL